MKQWIGRKHTTEIAKMPSRRQMQQSNSATLMQDTVDAPSSTYRRNRTITGSLSANVASTNEYNAELKSPRAHVHHLSKQRRKAFWQLSLVVAVVVMLYVLLSQAIASITVNVGSGTNLSVQRKKEYEQWSLEYFNSHPLQRVLFNVDASQLLAHMSQKYPEISAVHLDTSGVLGRVRMYLSLRQPIARWSLVDKNEFVDQQGVVFAYNAYRQPSLQIVDSSSVTLANGLVTSDRFLAFVGRVVGASKTHGLVVTEATIPPLTTRQLEIKVSGVTYPIKFTLDRTAGEQAEDMARAIRFLSQKSITPSYIDVRVEGRAAYR